MDQRLEQRGQGHTPVAPGGTGRREEGGQPGGGCAERLREDQAGRGLERTQGSLRREDPPTISAANCREDHEGGRAQVGVCKQGARGRGNRGLDLGVQRALPFLETGGAGWQVVRVHLAECGETGQKGGGCDGSRPVPCLGAAPLPVSALCPESASWQSPCFGKGLAGAAGRQWEPVFSWRDPRKETLALQGLKHTLTWPGLL